MFIGWWEMENQAIFFVYFDSACSLGFVYTIATEFYIYLTVFANDSFLFKKPAIESFNSKCFLDQPTVVKTNILIRSMGPVSELDMVS